MSYANLTCHCTRVNRSARLSVRLGVSKLYCAALGGKDQVLDCAPVPARVLRLEKRCYACRVPRRLGRAACEVIAVAAHRAPDDVTRCAEMNVCLPNPE